MWDRKVTKYRSLISCKEEFISKLQTFQQFISCALQMFYLRSPTSLRISSIFNKSCSLLGQCTGGHLNLQGINLLAENLAHASFW